MYSTVPNEYVCCCITTLAVADALCIQLYPTLTAHAHILQTIAEDVCDNLEHAYMLLTSKENIRTLKRGKTESQAVGKLEYIITALRCAIMALFTECYALLYSLAPYTPIQTG